MGTLTAYAVARNGDKCLRQGSSTDVDVKRIQCALHGGGKRES